MAEFAEFVFTGKLLSDLEGNWPKRKRNYNQPEPLVHEGLDQRKLLAVYLCDETFCSS